LGKFPIARLRVSGAITIRFLSDIAPSWMGVNSVLLIILLNIQLSDGWVMNVPGSTLIGVKE
jgi:hypothetical protein